MRILLTPAVARKLLDGSSQVFIRHDRLLWMNDNFVLLQESAISLGEDGSLIDGHHRCTIVVVTGRCLEVDLQTEPYSIELLPDTGTSSFDILTWE